MSTSAQPRLPHFLPLLEAASGLDLSDPGAARAELERRFPSGGEEAEALRARLLEWLARGEICERGELPMRWGRISKAVPESLDFTIDIVEMNGPGPRHRHPAPIARP